ncbi:hypothetical protein MferCBS31731_006008 [Microsporum ferrugineum]
MGQEDTEKAEGCACLPILSQAFDDFIYFFYPTPQDNKPAGWKRRQPLVEPLRASNLTSHVHGVAIIMYLNKEEDFMKPEETKDVAYLLGQLGRFVTRNEVLIRQKKAPTESIVSREEILEVLSVEQRLIFGGMGPQ